MSRRRVDYGYDFLLTSSGAEWYTLGMSKTYDKMKQVRLLPETVSMLEKWRRNHPTAGSIPHIVNVMIVRWLQGRVK